MTSVDLTSDGTELNLNFGSMTCQNLPGYGGAVGDKVGDWLHNVPAVLPPGQSGQNPELTRH